jgi:mannose-6-phosphate isomerase-like protein (cupin superfamily)
MMRSRRALLVVAAVAAGFWLARAGMAGDAPPPMFDALFPTGRQSLALASLAERVTLGAGEDLRVVEIARDTHTSHHVVAIRGAETPHRHDRHDLLVVMLRGHGRMRLGAEERPVGEGSILYVPRGSVHAFHNHAPTPAVALAIYAPAFDGIDRTPAGP